MDIRSAIKLLQSGDCQTIIDSSAIAAFKNFLLGFDMAHSSNFSKSFSEWVDGKDGDPVSLFEKFLNEDIKNED